MYTFYRYLQDNNNNKKIYFAQFWNPFESTDGNTGAYRLKDKVSVGYWWTSLNVPC